MTDPDESDTANTTAYTCDYEDDSIGLVGTVTGPAHTVTNGWEPTRDVLETKTNADRASPPVTVSAFDYGVNNLGQHTVANDITLPTTPAPHGRHFELGLAQEVIELRNTLSLFLPFLLRQSQ